MLLLYLHKISFRILPSSEYLSRLEEDCTSVTVLRLPHFDRRFVEDNVILRIFLDNFPQKVRSYLIREEEDRLFSRELRFTLHVHSTKTHIQFHSIVTDDTRVVPKVMRNYFLHANWEKQTKESAVVDGTSCCVILECLVTSIACIT